MHCGPLFSLLTPSCQDVPLLWTCALLNNVLSLYQPKIASSVCLSLWCYHSLLLICVFSSPSVSSSSSSPYSQVCVTTDKWFFSPVLCTWNHHSIGYPDANTPYDWAFQMHHRIAPFLIELSKCTLCCTIVYFPDINAQ